MKRIAAALAVLLAVGPAQAQSLPSNRVLPPEIYDRLYPGHLMLVRADTEEQVRELCPGVKFRAEALGCARPLGADYCVVVMAVDDVIRAAGHHPDIVLRHEIAHCLGWPSSHPGARAPTAEDWR